MSDIRKDEEALLLDHNYDGIRELDHMLPRWWVWLLYATIIFSIWYAGYYMFGSGPTPQQELAVTLKEIEALHPAPSAPNAGAETNLLAAIRDPESVKRGVEVYRGKCVACHGDLGQGTIGPNLTDDYWIHGSGRPQDVAQLIANGVADKGMPPWGQVLSEVEARDVVAFIFSIHGTNPAGAKAQQGVHYEFDDYK